MIDACWLRELALAANQEKWEFWHGDVVHSVDNEGAVHIARRPMYSGGKWQAACDANMRFIAEANPKAIGELLDELDQLRADSQRFAVLAELFADHAVALGKPYLETLEDVRAAMDYLIEQRNAAKEEV